MLKRISNTIEKIRSLNLETLESLRMGCFILICADLFGVWYYLGWKSLAGAILIVLMVVTGIIMYLIGQKPLKQELKPIQNRPKPEIQPQAQAIGDMLGLPSSEEYQDRMDKAFGG